MFTFVCECQYYEKMEKDCYMYMFNILFDNKDKRV